MIATHIFQLLSHLHSWVYGRLQKRMLLLFASNHGMDALMKCNTMAPLRIGNTWTISLLILHSRQNTKLLSIDVCFMLVCLARWQILYMPLCAEVTVVHVIISHFTNPRFCRIFVFLCLLMQRYSGFRNARIKTDMSVFWVMENEFDTGVKLISR